MRAKEKLPVHIGLILDGNRRWARENGLETLEGHRKGYDALKDIATHLFDRGVEYVSAFIFSTENWSRSKEEVDYLMDLALWVAKEEAEEYHRRNIRVLFAGDKKGIKPEILEAISNTEKKTAKNTGGTAILCFNYGGHREIIEATREIIKENLRPDEIDEDLFAKHLYVPDVPPIDLIIRTSGEQRISNFMLWRAAYSELMFLNKHWPAITTDDMDAALENFASRERRFGGGK